jgi:hypothetical protein
MRSVAAEGRTVIQTYTDRHTYMTRPIVAFSSFTNAPTLFYFIKDKTVFFKLLQSDVKRNNVTQYNKYTKVRIVVMYSTHYWREVSCLTRGLKTQRGLSHIAWSRSSYKSQL